jgi:PIN domain nuclease of toxin-antitoxin system
MGSQPLSRVLLDTHVLVWLLAGNARLGKSARTAIRKAADAGEVHVSSITPWEIALLVSKGRLILEMDVGEWVQAALSQPGIRLEPLSPEIAVASTRLPGILHADPADRILIATARHIGATLITADSLLLDYSRAGHVRTLKAE